MSTSIRPVLRFGVFELNLGTEELRKAGSLVRLSPQPFKLLALLAGQPGQLVTREQIQRQIWGDETFVDFEQGMNHCIKQIRAALGDNAEAPRYVETLPRRGYRFIAPVDAKTFGPGIGPLENGGVRPKDAIVPALSVVGRPTSPDPLGPASQKTPSTSYEAPQDGTLANAPTGVPNAPAGPGVAKAGEILPRDEYHLRAKQARLGRVGATIAIIVLILGGSAAYYLLRTRRTGTGTGGPAGAVPGAVKQRRSVAVLGFKNLSGRPESAPLSNTFSEFLTTELAAGEKLRAIPGEDVARTRVDLSLTDTESYGRNTLLRIRKNLQTDYVVLGSYLDRGPALDGKIRLDVQVQDTTSGETIARLSETGTEAQLLELVSRMGARLRERLGVGELSSSEEGLVQAALPSNAETARLYAEGLAKLRLFDALVARDLLQKAVTFDPGYAPAHSALATAWRSLGYDVKAKEEAKRAFDLSANLPRQDRLSVEAAYREITSQWDQAIALYQELWRGAQDNMDYGLQLASTEISARRGGEALATVARLRSLSLPDRDDPRIDLEEADAAYSLGDLKLEQAAAARAEERATVQGNWLVVARARHTQAEALFYQGNLDAALRIYQQALATYRRSGNQGKVASSLNNIADVLQEQGDFTAAGRMYQQSLRIYREIGNKRSAAGTLSNMGAVYQQQADLARAKSMYQQALAMDRDIGNESGQATDLNNIAEVLYGQGDLAGARSMHEQALAMDRASGDRLTAAEALFDLGEVLAAQGDLDGARKSHEEALVIRDDLGEVQSAAESRLALAKLWLEERHLPEGEALARKAAAEFHREKLADSEAQAEAVIAECLLAQGKVTEAANSIAPGLTVAVRSQNRSIRLSVAITAARIRAASGGRQAQADALDSLRQSLAAASKARLIGIEFEAAFALGRSEIQAGYSGAGYGRLAKLEKEATDHGFGLMARKAAATRQLASSM